MCVVPCLEHTSPFWLHKEDASIGTALLSDRNNAQLSRSNFQHLDGTIDAILYSTGRADLGQDDEHEVHEELPDGEVTEPGSPPAQGHGRAREERPHLVVEAPRCTPRPTPSGAQLLQPK